MIEIDFEDHKVEDNGIFKLHYVCYEYDKDTKMYNLVNWDCNPFKFPLGMNREEGFKVLSYLADYIEATSKVGEASFKSVILLDQVLNIERLGFKRLNPDFRKEAVSLFTIGGDLKEFKTESPLYEKYFEWYTPNSTEEEIKNIYNKIGKEFIKPVFMGNNTSQTLKREKTF